MTDGNALDCTLDENGLLHLRIDVQKDGRLKAHLYSEYAAESSLVANILPLMTVKSGGASFKPGLAAFALERPGNGKPVTLRIGKRSVVRFTLIEGHLMDLTSRHGLTKLSVFDTRTLGRAPQSETQGAGYPAAPYCAKKTTYKHLLPLTDLHTHLSAQVRAHDLIELARAHRKRGEEVYYPIVALKMLGIENSLSQIFYDEASVTSIKKRLFLPVAHLQAAGDGSVEDAVPLSRISAKGIALIERGMKLSPENQNTFGALEKCYYLREPFTKDIRFLEDILRTVAKRYHEQGITYAELSSTEIMNPSWIREIHRVLPTLEREYGNGMQLRFKVGLPRNIGETSMNERIGKYKHIAASPYIVGIDLLGYEINKTFRLRDSADKKDVLERLAGWIKENHPGDIMQVHAGENSKNLANVREALHLAHEYGVRVHVGHSLYGIDDDTLALARRLQAEGKLIAQFNLDSNLALNNIDFPLVPLKKFLANGIPCVLGSDGADIYGTDAQQIAMAAAYCGLNRKDFGAMRITEQKYIHERQKIFDGKRKEYERYSSFDAWLACQPPAPSKAEPGGEIQSAQEPVGNRERALLTLLSRLIDQENGRIPIFFGGAGGTSWSSIPDSGKQEFIHGLNLLMEQLDPKKMYFVKGRTKVTGGVNNELKNAIRRYNGTHDLKFSCVTVLAESEIPKVHEPNFHTTKLNASLMNFPDAIVEWLRARKGIAFYIGGNNFTRDFILASSDPGQGIPYGLMQGVNGASGEKGLIYKENKFTSGEGMVQYARKICLNIFRI